MEYIEHRVHTVGDRQLLVMSSDTEFQERVHLDMRDVDLALVVVYVVNLFLIIYKLTLINFHLLLVFSLVLFDHLTLLHLPLTRPAHFVAILHIDLLIRTLLLLA